MGVGQRGQTEAPFRMTQHKPGAPVCAGLTQDGRNDCGERGGVKRGKARGAPVRASYLAQRVVLTGAEPRAQLINSLKSPTSN